jgi:Ser/Thr protein kinase RdoA (MazF antagonist)
VLHAVAGKTEVTGLHRLQCLPAIVAPHPERPTAFENHDVFIDRVGMGHDNESSFRMDPDYERDSSLGTVAAYNLDPLVQCLNREFLQRNDVGVGYRLREGVRGGPCTGNCKEQIVEVRASVHALVPWDWGSADPVSGPYWIMTSVLYSTISSIYIEHAVLGSYPLAGPLACRFFHRGLNDTYRVSGPNGRFGFRVYRASWRQQAAVAAELDALRHLDASGVSVSMPVSRSDGADITEVDAIEGVRAAVLFKWIDGVEPRYTDANQAALYGALAAQLHQANAGVPSSAVRPSLNRGSLFEEPIANLLSELGESPVLAARLWDLADRTNTRLIQAERELDWGFCHGDLHGGNARVLNNRLTLFDFDCCAHGWQIYDLATYRWAARLRRAEENAWPSFKEAYLKARPSAAAWMKWVPLFMIVRHLWLMGLHVGNADEMGHGFATEEFFDRLITFCEEIESVT